MAVINGTSGNDQLDGTSGDDIIDGGSGNDVINGRAGNDILIGGNGRDTIDGGAGDDTIDGGDGGDFVDGGDGDDTIDTGNGPDVVFGGSGDDTITPGNGPDVVDGGDGDDTIDTGNGPDVVDGGDGDDTISLGNGPDQGTGGAGDDTIYGGRGPDTLSGGDGDDTLFGGGARDVLSGGDGNDTLDGGANNDTMYGDDGDDTLILTSGNDTAYGGQDSDTFYVTAGNHYIVGGENDDDSDIDVLDLSGAGNYTVEFTGPESGFIYFLNDQGHVYRTTEFKEIERIICFTPGTGIATMQGQRAVEDLRVGDRVFTRDNGAQKIRWIGRKKISLGTGTLSQKLQPILIRSGALVHGLPDHDMLVSPNHRMLLTSKRAQLYFGESEVLVAAKHLVGKPEFEHWVTAQIEYVHFLCDHHEIVLANGAWSETFQPGDYSLAGLGEPQRAEIYQLFPELKKRTHKSPVYAAARRSLKQHEAQSLRD